MFANILPIGICLFVEQEVEDVLSTWLNENT